MTHNTRRAITWYISALILMLGGISAHAADWGKAVDFEPISVNEISPEQISPEKLIPGLEALYYLKFFERHLDQLPKTKQSKYTFFNGEPVRELNHQFGKQKVFGSGTNRGIGLRMTGYLLFDEPGSYEMQALSNDGVSVRISGVLAINDPEQHSDRLSNVAQLKVDEPGWYPVVIEYFQRKGTAALKLFWKTPMDGEFVPVPAKAYSHQP